MSSAGRPPESPAGGASASALPRPSQVLHRLPAVGTRRVKTWDERLTGERINRALAECKAKPETPLLRLRARVVRHQGTLSTRVGARRRGDLGAGAARTGFAFAPGALSIGEAQTGAR